MAVKIQMKIILIDSHVLLLIIYLQHVECCCHCYFLLLTFLGGSYIEFCMHKKFYVYNGGSLNLLTWRKCRYGTRCTNSSVEVNGKCRRQTILKHRKTHKILKARARCTVFIGFYYTASAQTLLSSNRIQQ